MALAAESGELMEHFLWSTAEESKAVAADAAKRGKIADELADVVIYALEFANITGLDLAAAIESKMAADAKKYPVEKARGRSDRCTSSKNKDPRSAVRDPRASRPNGEGLRPCRRR
jgi:NTP pyrophosphatase (non-canonical NTP hydrolase)